MVKPKGISVASENFSTLSLKFQEASAFKAGEDHYTHDRIRTSFCSQAYLIMGTRRWSETVRGRQWGPRSGLDVDTQCTLLQLGHSHRIQGYPGGIIQNLVMRSSLSPASLVVRKAQVSTSVCGLWLIKVNQFLRPEHPLGLCTRMPFSSCGVQYQLWATQISAAPLFGENRSASPTPSKDPSLPETKYSKSSSVS